MNMPISRTQSKALSNAPPTGPCLKLGSSARDRTDLKGGRSFFKFKGNAANSSWTASPQASRKVARKRNLWHLLWMWRRRNKSRRSSLGNSLLKNSSRDVKSPAPSVEGVVVIIARQKSCVEAMERQSGIQISRANRGLYPFERLYSNSYPSPHTKASAKVAESAGIYCHLK